MELFAISGIINAVISLGLGTLVVFKNWHTKSNRLFFWMTVSLFAWGMTYWRWQSATSATDALFWIRIVGGASLFIPILFFHWIVNFLGLEKSHKPMIVSSYVVAFFRLFFLQSPLFIPSVEKRLFFDYWPDAGILYSIYVFFIYATLILYSIFLLIRSYRVEKDSSRKHQIIYILAGAIIGFGGGAFNFPLWFDVDIMPYETFLVAAFPLLYSYSLIKYKLFNIKAAVAEVLVLFIVLILIIETVMSQNLTLVILRGVFTIAVSIFGYLLVRSIYREIEQKERIQKLADDLTRSNDQLFVANEKLKVLDQQKTEFVSIASHQLRTPLTAIKGYSSMLMEGSFGELGKDALDAADRIFQSSQRLNHIIEDFLNVTRIELGKMKYEQADIDLREIVSVVVKEARLTAEKRGLTLDFEDDNQKHTIFADSGKISQVVSNLIDNAIKYTKQGWIKVKIETAGEKEIVAISDSGVGITPEALPKLFEKFVRADDAGKVNISGTGLGLYVAKQIVEAHHGRIWAESTGAGQGSTFKIELPKK